MNFNERFMDIRFKMKEKERLQSLRTRIEGQQKELEEKKRELEVILEKEEKDVKKLEGMSLAHFIHLIKGDVGDVLYKEQQEAISAKMKYDGVCSELEAVNSELSNVRRQLNEFGNLDEQYRVLIKEKAEYIKNNNGLFSDELEDIIEKQSGVKRAKKEIEEALFAGKELMRALDNVQKNIKSAKGWGVYDMMGGGLIATMAKHSRLEEANAEISRAQSLLTRFHRELKDVGEYLDINIEIGSFLGFADYFFDGLFADWAVQSRINDADGRVRDTIYKVQSLLGRLEGQNSHMELELEKLENKRLEVIEKA